MLASNSLLSGLVERHGVNNSLVGKAKHSADWTSVLRTGALITADLFSFLLLLLMTDLAVFAGELSFGQSSGGSRFLSLAGVHCVGAVLVGIIMITKGQYTERSSFWCEARRLAAASALAAIVVMFEPFEHVNLLLRFAAAGLWLLFPAWAIVIRNKTREVLDYFGVWQIPVVILAPTAALGRVSQTLNSQRPFDFKIVDEIALEKIDSSLLPNWKATLAEHRASRIIVAAAPSLDGLDKILDSIVRSRIPFMVILDHGVLPVYGGHDTRMLRSDSVLTSYQVGLSRPVVRKLKVALDLTIASLLIAFLAPLMILLAALIVTDGGPVFFAHKRIGRGGRHFQCLKFRTMAVNGDEILARTLARDPAALAEWKATRKLRLDPRVTRVGRVLRSTSLDELPQLFNVLRFDMSLVGPRPIVQDEVSLYAEDIVFYHETRPGLTGLWQISGRSDTSYEERVAYDRWYVKNWTLWHDFVILWLTLPAVVARSGAR